MILQNKYQANRQNVKDIKKDRIILRSLLVNISCANRDVRARFQLYYIQLSPASLNIDHTHRFISDRVRDNEGSRWVCLCV